MCSHNNYIHFVFYSHKYLILFQWDLVCDKAAVGALSQTFLTIGMGAGASLIPHFADRYGRRPVVIICLFGIWAFSLGLGFSPSYNVFMALRFMIGFFQQVSTGKSFCFLIK